jgi:DNA replication protein DnaC
MHFVVPIRDGIPARAIPCACWQEKLAQRQQQALLQQSQLPPKLMAQGFHTFVAQTTAHKTALSICQTFTQDPCGWLWLQEKVNSGVSHLIAGIAHHRLNRNLPVYYTETTTLLDTLRATFDTGNYDQMFRETCRHPLLLLTHLGYEQPTPWSQEKLYQLLHYRDLYDLPTVITSTLPLLPMDRRIAGILTHHPYCQTLFLCSK